MKDYLLHKDSVRGITENDLKELKIGHIKDFVRRYGTDADNQALSQVCDLDDLVNLAKNVLQSSQKYLYDVSTKYDLVSNICHDSPITQSTSIAAQNVKEMKVALPRGSEKRSSEINVLQCGTYRVHIQNKATGQWYECQDLHVTETMPQMIGVSESYMLIYEKKISLPQK